MADTKQAVSGAATGAAAGSAFGPWGAAIGGTLGLVGGLMQNSGSKAQSERMMWLQNALEENRMKNAHQWEAEDLAKAGLNKALTASGPTAGSIAGSSAKGGELATQFNQITGNQKDQKLNRAINSAARAMDFFNEVDRIKNETKLTTAKTENVDADTTTKLLNNKIIQKYGSKAAKQNLANEVLKGQQIQANTANITYDTMQKQQDIIQNTPQTTMEKDYSNFLEKHPYVKNAINTINRVAEIGGNVMEMVGAGFKPIAAMSAAKNLKRLANTRIDKYNSKGVHKGTTQITKY